MNTNNIRFQKVTRIRIQILLLGLKYSNYIRIPNYLFTSGAAYLLKLALFFVILLVKMKFSGSSTSSNSHEQSGVSTNSLRSSKSDILKHTFSIKVWKVSFALTQPFFCREINVTFGPKCTYFAHIFFIKITRLSPVEIGWDILSPIQRTGQQLFDRGMNAFSIF